MKRKIPFEAVVGFVEVKLTPTHDALYINRVRHIANISQLSNNKGYNINVCIVADLIGCIARASHGRCLLWV